MEPQEVAAALKALPEEMARHFQLTIDVVLAFMGPGLMLVDWLESKVGSDGPRFGAALLQGYDNETSLAGAALSGLGEKSS